MKIEYVACIIPSWLYKTTQAMLKRLYPKSVHINKGRKTLRQRRFCANRLSVTHTNCFYETVVIGRKSNSRCPTTTAWVLDTVTDDIYSFVTLEKLHTYAEARYLIKSDSNKIILNHTFVKEFDTDIHKTYYTDNENDIYVLAYNDEHKQFKIVICPRLIRIQVDVLAEISSMTINNWDLNHPLMKIVNEARVQLIEKMYNEYLTRQIGNVELKLNISDLLCVEPNLKDLVNYLNQTGDSFEMYRMSLSNTEGLADEKSLTKYTATITVLMSDADPVASSFSVNRLFSNIDSRRSFYIDNITVRNVMQHQKVPILTKSDKMLCLLAKGSVINRDTTDNADRIMDLYVMHRMTKIFGRLLLSVLILIILLLVVSFIKFYHKRSEQ